MTIQVQAIKKTEFQPIIMFGKFNTTKLNKEFIIRFTPKDIHGVYAKKSRLISARQMCVLVGDTPALEKMISRIWDDMTDCPTWKLRNTGMFEFNYR